MVLIKRGKVVMTAAVDTDECNFSRIDLLQRLAMPDWYQPVFGAMNDIGMAFYPGYPDICP